MTEEVKRDTTEKGKLLQLIQSGFTLDELKVTAFSLGIEWDLLTGDALSTRAISLINYVCRHEHLDALRSQLELQLPETDWSSIEWSKINEQMPVSLNENNGAKFNLGCSWRRFSLMLNFSALVVTGIYLGILFPASVGQKLHLQLYMCLLLAQILYYFHSTHPPIQVHRLNSL